jgi:hypothetical protein
MPWYRAISSEWVIQDEFEKIWMASGGPVDAALFGQRDISNKVTEFYFNPAAARIAPHLVASYAHECPEPNIRNLALLQGDQRIFGESS